MAEKSIMDVDQEEEVPEELKTEVMPNHVALIMDGNRRWAKERGMEVTQGHQEGKRVMLEILRRSSKWGIKVLSLFAFSTENWSRPKEEVNFLMSIIQETTEHLQEREEECASYNVRVSFMGDRSKLPEYVTDAMNKAEERTKLNKGLHVMIGLNYGGRYDILQATKSIAGKVKDGIRQADDICESMFSEELQTSTLEYPVPDLLIRTSGEQRISNFMLWQMAYTELYFCNKYFPEFERQDYVDALVWFQKRDRRFGGKY